MTKRTFINVSIVSLGAGGLLFFLAVRRAAFNDFVSLTLSDPLFYAPLADTRALRDAAAALEHNQKQLLSIIDTYYRTPQDPFAVVQRGARLPDILPTKLLLILADTTDLTDDFFLRPTRPKAERLIALYEAGAAAYRDAIDQKRELLKKIRQTLGRANPVAIVSLGSTTSLATVGADLEIIAKNAEALQRETRERKHCLIWLICRHRPGSVDIDPSVPFHAIKQSYDFALLPINILYKEQHEKVSGPYRTASVCWGNLRRVGDAPVPVYLIERSGQGKGKEVLFKIGTENYYWDNSRSSLPYERFLVKNGSRWNQQLETTDYLCADHRFRFELTTLDYFLDLLRREASVLPAMSVERNQDNADPGELIKSARTFEARLLTDPLPGTADLERLTRLYGAIAENAPAFPTTQDQQKFYRRLALLKNKLVRLPEIAESLVTNLEFFKVVLLINKDGPLDVTTSPYYIWLVRGQPGLFAFPFSASFWRIPDALRYTEGPKGAIPDAPYKTYTELKAVYSPEEIKTFILDDQKFLEKHLPQEFWEEYKKFL